MHKRFLIRSHVNPRLGSQMSRLKTIDEFFLSMGSTMCGLLGCSMFLTITRNFQLFSNYPCLFGGTYALRAVERVKFLFHFFLLQVMTSEEALYGRNTLNCRKTSKKNARYYSPDYCNQGLLLKTTDSNSKRGYLKIAYDIL